MQGKRSWHLPSLEGRSEARFGRGLDGARSAVEGREELVLVEWEEHLLGGGGHCTVLGEC